LPPLAGSDFPSARSGRFSFARQHFLPSGSQENGRVDEARYQNTPTVVVALVPLRGGLLMIRRAHDGEGQGRLALPGGYQMLGQTWREAGAREVLEETGVVIDPASLRVLAVETTPDRRQNLLFCRSAPAAHAGAFVHDAEVSEVLVIHEPVETAFALHTRMVRAFFSRRRL
jgi:ADP-ribose pyrophosphatase YjhB (NUDIX family)